MARSKLFYFVLIAGAVMAATPALAQFGSIFSDHGPPRPPADVPDAPSGNNAPPYYAPSQPSPPPTYYPSQDDRRYYPSQPPQYGQPQYQQPQYQPPQYRQPAYQQRQFDPNAPRPPADVRTGADDVPPSEPQPPPMSLPPSSRPGGGTIQSQELAPLPGAPQAPAQQPAQANTNPVQPPPAQAPGAPAAPGVQPQQPAQAQPGQPQQPAASATPGAPPTEEVVVEPPPERIGNPTAVFAGLDKITGRIISFDVAINETVQFGALQVTPRVCYSRPPTETPNTDAFVEVDEVTLQGEIKRIFTGWMFAASPGLHAVEHPIYDVWLTDCKGGKNPAVAEASPEDTTPKPAAKPAHAPARRAVQPRAQRPAGTLPALR